MRSHAGVRIDLFRRDPTKVLLTDFFGGVAQAEIVAPADVDDARDFARSVSQSKQTVVDLQRDGHSSVSSIWSMMGSRDSNGLGWGLLGYWRAWASSILILLVCILVRIVG